MRQVLDRASITILSCLTEADERVLADDVLDGLTRPFKELPPKHFYDARGSELFDQICELPEYYPTRTERLILERHATQIVEETAASELVELGSGSPGKARILLDAMAQAGSLRRYIPLDVSQRALQEAAEQLVTEYDGLQVDGVIGDFERHLDSVPSAGPDSRIVALLGGTVGNFPPGTRRRFLRQIGRLLVSLNWREDQLDRPLGGHALCLERVGEAEAAHNEIGHCRATTVELPFHILAFAERHARWQQRQLGGKMGAVQIGATDFNQLHRQLAPEKPRQRHLELRVGK